MYTASMLTIGMLLMSVFHHISTIPYTHETTTQLMFAFLRASGHKRS